MKNKAIDTHNILFEQLKRLNNLNGDDMEGEKMANEIRRAEAISKVASQIISNGKLVVDAYKMAEEYGLIDLPDMLTCGENLDNKNLSNKSRLLINRPREKD